MTATITESGIEMVGAVSVTVPRAKLAAALATVRKIVANRSPKPILCCVRIDATCDGLSVTGTDIEHWVSVPVAGAEIARPGVIVADAAALAKVLKSTTKKIVTLESRPDGGLTVHACTSSLIVQGFPPSEYPGEPDAPAAAGYWIDAPALRAALARTTFAVSRENTRYAINGVFFERRGDKLNVVATDGHRMAVAESTVLVDRDAAEAESAIVPTSAALALFAALKGVTGSVAVRADVADDPRNDGAPRIRFDIDGPAVVSAMQMVGHFPPWRDVIPVDPVAVATMAAGPLADALKAVATMTDHEYPGARMAFHFGNGGGPMKLELTPTSPDYRGSSIPVDIAGWDLRQENTGGLDIGMNPKLLGPGVANSGADRVTVELWKANRPAVVRADGYTFVCLPMTLAE